MCGINGFNWTDERLIKQMNEAIKHRGPDDNGIFVEDGVSLGSVRLAILDLSKKGHMPMFSDDKKLAIVHNGEIYNFNEIKEVLMSKGYSFKSHTDTEVILYAYKEWGSECVKRFNGMWAFAIYDIEKKRMFVSRDRFGVKPFYYYFQDGEFIFSSEIKGILEHPIKREPNDAIVYDFLYYSLSDHTEETFFKGIKNLPPGHSAILDLKKKELNIFRYYNLYEQVAEHKRSASEIQTAFLGAVKKRLISDVPVGSCLSGGIDSSAIVCCMDELGKNDVEVFSLVFPGKRIDESAFQEEIVKKTGAKWHKTTFNGEDILKDLEELVYTQEEPFDGLSIYGQYRVMKLARDNKIKVVLDGQGGDEILLGYHSFFACYFVELFRGFRWPQLIKEILAYRRVHGSLSPVLTMVGMMLPSRLFEVMWGGRQKFLSSEFTKRFAKRGTKRLLMKTRDCTEASLLAETYHSLPHLLRYEDKNSMRWSVESRVPFCDYEFVEKIISLPTESRISGADTKRIFREAMAGILPDKIRLRKDKIGFETPDAEILRTSHGGELARSIINSETFKSRAYWNWAKVASMLENHIKKRCDNAKPIWKMIILELWLREFIDNNGAGKKGK